MCSMTSVLSPARHLGADGGVQEIVGRGWDRDSDAGFRMRGIQWSCVDLGGITCVIASVCL